MINVNYDIGAIENELWQAMKTANVCSVIYPNRRPTSASANASAFIVVKSVTEIVDKYAFGKNICRIEVYTKSLGTTGVKDSASATALAKKVMDALPVVTPKYQFTYLSNISLGLDNTGYDVEAYNLNVLIL